MKGKERRKYKRFPVDLNLKYSLILDDLTGKIKNISQGGFMFSTPERLEKNIFLAIEFKLKRKMISTYAKVIWVKEIEDHQFDVGAKFVDIEGGVFDKELNEFIKSLEE